VQESSAREQCLIAFEFKHRRPHEPRFPATENPTRPAGRPIEGGFEHALHRGFRAGNVERDRFRPGRGINPAARPSAADIAKVNGAHRHQTPQYLLEHAAHRRRFPRLAERARQRGQEIGERLSSVALPGDVCERRAGS
jgi:hypothetical protein